MQSVKLTIPGAYWDSHLYKGRLYLFERGGAIRVINWDSLINTWAMQEQLRLPVQLAFAFSDYLYDDRFSLLFADEELKQLVFRRFEALAQQQLVVDGQALEHATLGRQDNPFPFPHSDMTIYYSQIFATGSSGVFRGSCGQTQLPVSQRPKKANDIPAVALAANYGSLALAGGDDGLFELPVVPFSDSDRKLRHLVKTNTSDCNWMYQSIFGSSHLGLGNLAEFSSRWDPLPDTAGLPDQAVDTIDDRVWEDEDSDPWTDDEVLGTRRGRHLRRVVPADEIFQTRDGYAWGRQDKICLASNRSVTVVSYRPWRRQPLENIGTVSLAEWKGDIVAGGVAQFGTIIECENAIVVMLSDGLAQTIHGEPINWRVFPRSKHYSNQLQIVYDDRVEVHSFNQDYLVDQRLKVSGTSRPRPLPYPRKRLRP